MKIRKSVKYICICISLILILISCVNIGSSMARTNTLNTNKEIYNYKNKFSYNYTVNLLSNKFMPEKSMGMSQNYFVTDLIDNIKLDLNYTYEGSSKTDINYDYQIVGVLSAVYVKDGVECKVWEKEDVLKKLVKDSANDTSASINESLNLNLKKQNKLVKEFEDEMGMSLTANYTIMLKVNTNTNVEDVQVTNEYNPLITISLAEKVTTITGDNNLENTEYVSKQDNEAKKASIPYLIVNIIIFVAGLGLLKFALSHKSINVVRNEYRHELNRILKLCQDKIIQVSKKPNIEQGKIIDVNDFGEIIKASEELFKPILYWFNEKTEEAEFNVLSDNVIYKYILKK